MEVTVGARMGGPELGATVLPMMASLRQALKREWTSVVADDITSIDYVLFFNGSITEYSSTAGTQKVKYSTSEKTVEVEIVFDASEATGDSRTRLTRSMQNRFLVSLDAIAEAIDKHGLTFDNEAARRAVLNSFLAVESAR